MMVGTKVAGRVGGRVGGRALVMASGLALASVLSGTALGANTRVSVGIIEIEDAPLSRPGELAWLTGDSKPTLRQLVEAIDRGAADADLDAIVIRLRDAALGATQVEELGAAITRAREAGKKVHVFSEAYGTTELMLGAYADEVIGQAGGDVLLGGLYMEEMFLADTMAWAGLKADMVQVGDYKGANEMMSRSAPSPQWDSNINQLLDSMYARVRAPIMVGRGLDDAKLDAAMEKLWLGKAEQARDLGLIDSVIDLPDLTDHLSKVHGGKVEWDDSLVKTVEGPAPDMSNPFAMFAMLAKKPETKAKRPTIAVLHIDGAIVDGDSTASGFSGETSVGSRTIRNAIEDILKQDLIKGVVVRIDSPGGSATASEIMYQGLSKLAEEKPVWASVGSMAASGGYYVAVGTDRIFVNPSSILGSIGVVGGKISMKGLYENLKVNVVGRGRGPNADLFASATTWDASRTAMVRAKMQETYDQFTSRVTAGRQGIDLSKTAEGRLFTGDKAIELKMADDLGGLDEAIAAMAEQVDLSDYDVMDFPAPKSLEEALQDALGGFVSAPGVGSSMNAGPMASMAQAARAVLGPRAWRQVARHLDAFMLLRDEPVLLTSPRALIVRP